MIDDKFIVTDSGNHRIQVFNSSGQFLFKFGSKGSSVGQFNYPCGIAFNSITNQIVIVEYDGNRFQIFG